MSHLSAASLQVTHSSSSALHFLFLVLVKLLISGNFFYGSTLPFFGGLEFSVLSAVAALSSCSG